MINQLIHQQIVIKDAVGKSYDLTASTLSKMDDKINMLYEQVNKTTDTMQTLGNSVASVGNSVANVGNTVAGSSSNLMLIVAIGGGLFLLTQSKKN